MGRPPFPGVALRFALMAFRAITLYPTVTLLTVERVLFLLLAMDNQPVGCLMVVRHRFFGVAGGTGIRCFFAVVTLIAGDHRRAVPFGRLRIMNQVPVTIHALKTPEFCMRVVRYQKVA